MHSLLITRPRYEKVTYYLYHWSTGLVSEANKKCKVFDLKKEKASKKFLESYLKKQKPEIVILNGHGNENCVTGHDGEVLIAVGDNTKSLKDCVVYMRACSAGKILGHEIMKHGAKAFIGYKEPFRFYSKTESVQHPLEDEYAKPFFETSNQVGLSLIKGRTAKEAQADSLKLYRKTISNLLTSKTGDLFLFPDLIWNMAHQVCY